MWRNTEVHAFADWLRDHNKPLPPGKRVSFHGLDIYSLSASIGAVLSYLDRVDPKAAKIARRRYGCLTPWQDEPEAYGYGVLSGKSDSCEDEALAQLSDMLSKRLADAQADSEAYFDAVQNARIVRAAEPSTRKATRPLASDAIPGKGAPLRQCDRASLLVNLPGDEMPLLIEMISGRGHQLN